MFIRNMIQSYQPVLKTEIGDLQPQHSEMCHTYLGFLLQTVLHDYGYEALHPESRDVISFLQSAFPWSLYETPPHTDYKIIHDHDLDFHRETLHILFPNHHYYIGEFSKSPFDYKIHVYSHNHHGHDGYLYVNYLEGWWTYREEHDDHEWKEKMDSPVLSRLLTIDCFKHLLHLHHDGCALRKGEHHGF